MNKTFKTLFTLFLGILIFIPTFTANSNAQTQQKENHILEVNFCKRNVYYYVIATVQLCSKVKGYGAAKYTDSNLSEFNKYIKIKRKIAPNYSRTFCLRKDDSKSTSIETKFIATRYSCKILGPDYEEIVFDGKKFYASSKPTQTQQVVKKEPTQTQQVAKKKKVKKQKVTKLKKTKQKSKAETKSIKRKLSLSQLIGKKQSGDTEKVPFESTEDRIDRLYAEGKIDKENCVLLKKQGVLDVKNPSCNKVEVAMKTTNKTNRKIFKIGNEKCIPTEKSGLVKEDGKLKFIPYKIYCISMNDIAKLGIYQEFNAYPEGMLKEFKNCKKFHCQSKIASKKMYEIFVRRGPTYHARHPGKMIHGMAWYEIMYLAKHKKTMPVIERYIKYKEGNHNYKLPWMVFTDESSINSLIGMNKGRKNMRTAMGFSLDDNLAKVVNGYWLLGDFIANDKLKVKKVKLDSALKKRKELLAQYQSVIKKYKQKLEKGGS